VRLGRPVRLGWLGKKILRLPVPLLLPLPLRRLLLLRWLWQ
jgi:hypothetical protein